MSALTGEYYYEKIGTPAPRGLANPTTCVADLEAIASSKASNKASASATELTTKCQQLNRAMIKNAMTYVIYLQWVNGQAAEARVSVTPSEFQRFFARMKAEDFPTEADLQTYLANKGWTLSDELTSARKEALASKLLQALGKTGGVTERDLTKKWTAMTSCRPGYVVEQCEQYKASATASAEPSAAVLIEEIEAL